MKILTPLLVLLFTLLFSIQAMAKRVIPAEIKAIKKDGNEYNVRYEESKCQNSKNICGDITRIYSRNIKTGKINWEKEIYLTMYNSLLEIDVQQIYLRSLKLTSKGKIEIVDEMGMKYLILAKNGTMIEPLKTVIYPAEKSY